MEPVQESLGGCSSVFILFFAKKSMTKSDQSAGAFL